MAAIKSKNTKPELMIRKGLFAKGFRYKVHDKNLPGKPDLVLPKYNAVIFIHGCFWHGHGCHLFKWPKTRTEFWKDKIEGNKARDKKVLQKLKEKGWRTLVIWECSIKGVGRQDVLDVVNEVSDWLKTDSMFNEIRGAK